MGEHEIVDLVAGIATVAERIGGAGDAVALREELARARSGAAAVVVVGEKKRGKSSLINALVGRPGLLPVEADVATTVHLVVRHAAEPRAVAVTEEHPGGIPIGLDDLPAYASLDPVTGRVRRSGVRSVEVGVPSDLLGSGLMLIDTPGVGGLVAGHAAITMATLNAADALMFVVNGSSELTASECRFLQRATERIATVFFVLTQIDKYPSWRDTLAANHELLAQHAPRYANAPWFAVSARKAAAGGRHLADSGVPELADALQARVASRADDLRSANLLQSAYSVARRLADQHEVRLRALAGDEELVRSTERQRAGLLELQAADAAWRRQLAEHFKKLDTQLRLTYQRLAADLRDAADYRVLHADPYELATLADDLDAGMRGIWMELETTVEHNLAELAGQLAWAFDEQGVDALSRTIAYPERLRDLPPLVIGDGGAAPVTGMHLVERYGPGMSIAFALGHIVLSSVNPLLLLGLGGFIGHSIHKQRAAREQAAQARVEAQRFVQSVFRELGTEVPAAVSQALEERITLFDRALSAKLAARRAELEQTLAESAAARNISAAELAQARAETEQRLALVRPLLERCVRLLSRPASPPALTSGAP
ncbi:dynamin family protein [Dactylosporangium darangshiense]|uniref:Dynamin family protein n=1 Tax=Dactylosporangium darangshiense TaxID=579108 RepID=A0ABP8DHJ4_9ACTN